MESTRRSQETIRKVPPEEPPTWWAQYRRRLEGSLSPRSLQVLEIDSGYLLDQGVHGAGPAGSPGWPVTRYRSGLVMGSVQSGKTASMLAVTTMAIDAGIDIVVVLAGTRLALWRQTYDRLFSQVLANQPGHLLPTPAVMAQNSGVSLDSLFTMTSARLKRALSRREPVVLVVMKHGQHLRAASTMLHERAYCHLDTLGRPAHLLVFDDEADDGSILDAAVETAADPTLDHLKQIPRHVVDLWATRRDAPETAHPRLFATYVAYTATPQANLLQADQNPLAPQHFVATLRTPANVGMLEPRSTTFDEPQGYRAYYSGGEVFYHQVAAGDALVSCPDDTLDTDPAGRQQWIAHAVRAWLVAAAVRRHRDPEGRRYAGLADTVWDDRAKAVSACPPPHSMLVHPSPSVSDQFEALAEVLAWGRDLDLLSAREAVGDGVRELAVDVLERDMDDQPGEWSRWLREYQESAAAVGAAFELEAALPVPGEDIWPQVRALLVEDVIPAVRLSVVNSDPNADDRPQFAPAAVGGRWRAPADLLTVFVSGNVMARGLTLEGLTTTLFLRTSADPAADTQMQMQRWFGYRGPYLELCRVFLPQAQRALFAQYHDADEALRRQVVAAMNDTPGRAPSPLVLEGRDFRATGKIEAVSKVPLCPGATPFVTTVNDGANPDPNVDLLVSVFQRPSHDLSVAGTLRGRVLDQPLTLEGAAGVLDGLRYRDYVPDPDDPLSTRWSSLEAQLGLGQEVAQPLVPLFRPPTPRPGQDTPVLPPSRCPYSIAAYLRLWAACLTRHARGLFPTDRPDAPWSLLDLAERRLLQPTFSVGLRYGSADPVGPADPGGEQLASLGFVPHPMARAVSPHNTLDTWGSRNPSTAPDAYLGDQLFDYHDHHSPLLPDVHAEGAPWRPPGAPGLLLFHLVRAPDRPYPVVGVGIALPLGGPDHFAARPRR